MATNQTECLPYKRDYAAYVSPDIKVGYATLILQLYITQTCTYTHTKSQGTFKKHRIRHAHCLLCDSLPCGIYWVDASEWGISNTVFQCDQAKTNANEMSSSLLIQLVNLIQKQRMKLQVECWKGEATNVATHKLITLSIVVCKSIQCRQKYLDTWGTSKNVLMSLH